MAVVPTAAVVPLAEVVLEATTEVVAAMAAVVEATTEVVAALAEAVVEAPTAVAAAAAPMAAARRRTAGINSTELQFSRPASFRQRAVFFFE